MLSESDNSPWECGKLCAMYRGGGVSLVKRGSPPAVSLRSKRFCGVQGQRITAWKKRGEGRGRKETLADKPLGFENRPLCLSCLTDFMLSSSIQVAFVILVLTRFEILDFTVFFCLIIRIIQGYPTCQRGFFCIFVTKLGSWAAKPLIKASTSGYCLNIIWQIINFDRSYRSFVTKKKPSWTQGNTR